MKKLLIALSLLLVVLAVSCTTSSSSSLVSAREVPENLLEYKPYASSYSLNKDGKLHFYFLAASNDFVRTSKKTGDACLVLFPNGETMLIDSGNTFYAPVLVTSLLQMGVTYIDYFVLSHPHGDHYGGLTASESILNYFDIGAIYYNGVDTTLFKNVSSVAKKHGIPIEVLVDEQAFQVGDVRITALNPPISKVGAQINEETEINDASLVIRIDYKKFSALFTGDMYVNAEADIVKRHADLLDVDLLKICHHGRPTSSTVEFIQATTPKLAVATGNCPMETKYYERYRSVGTVVLQDFCDGYVHVWTSGNGFKYEHSLERTITIYD